MKKLYFKFVDAEKGHHGIFYIAGRNVDTLEFNPSGNCESGGIYFSSKDILAFIGYGDDLYEVTPVGEIYENPGYPKKYKSHAVDMKYIGKRTDVKVIKYLIDCGADVHADSNAALRYAAKKGHIEVVKYLKSIINNNPIKLYEYRTKV